MAKILVVGSAAMDFTLEADRLPEQGETLQGNGVTMFSGGKGANQAVAIARLGGKVDLCACIGEDIYGESVLRNLEENGVGTKFVQKIKDQPTGTAHIFLIRADNRILIIPGANGCLSPAIIRQELQNTLSQYDLVVLQNEIPPESNDLIMELCGARKIPLLYNPAPAREKSIGKWDQKIYLIPNESECHQLFPGLSIEEAATKYSNQLIVTLGSRGAMFHDGKILRIVPAINTVAVDTTGAGDTFNGALAVAITQGASLFEAVEFGNQAAALSILKKGAQTGMPTLAEVRQLNNKL